jgi:branched-subunit amino acid ABC-type transport system permease component
MKSKTSRITLVEVMVAIAVIATVALPFVRYKYGKEITAWEHHLAESMGIPIPIFYGILLAAFIYSAYRRNQREKSNQEHRTTYKLPNEK